jgi:Flp pilus assembly protein TadD
LLLGACSQAPDLLTSLTEDPNKIETSSNKTAGAEPQTELQKATIYWGGQYAKQPTNLEFALNYAKDLKALGEKQKALGVLQQISMFHNNDHDLLSEYGRLALELDQVNVANQLLAMADDPTKPDWRVTSARGTVMAKQGKYAEAIPFYERALAIAPSNPSVMNNLAMAYAMNGDPKKAEGILRQAWAAPGATPKVRENLALVLGLQGRYDESKSVASSVLDSVVASANATSIRQMVKLEPKNEMPDARSFAAQTSVAQTSVAQAPEPPRPTAPSNVAVDTGSLPATPAAWQTSVDDAPPVVAFKTTTAR